MYTGHGKFKPGKALLRALTSKTAQRIGSKAALRGVEALIGSGAYASGDKVHTNALVEGIMSGDHNYSPRYTAANDETGSIMVTKREYVTDIFGPTVPFENQVYALNPALASTTDWLSQLASNFEQYEFIQLVAEYRSTTTDIGSSTNGQCGTVIMTTNYNAAAPNFTDKVTMMEYQGSQSCKTTEHMIHGVECDREKVALGHTLYTRSGPVPTGQDPKTYDHGTLQVGIANIPAGFENQVLGELWLYYKVKLSVPKLHSARGLSIPRDVFTTPSSAARGLVNTGSNPFASGTNQVLYAGQMNSLGAEIVPSPTGCSIIFPVRFTGAVAIHFIVDPVVAVVGANLAINNIGKGGNIEWIQDMFSEDGSPTYSVNSAAVAPTWTGDVMCTIHAYVNPASSGVDNQIVLGMLAGVASIVQASISIYQYNNFGLTTTSDSLICVNPDTGIAIAASQI